MAGTMRSRRARALGALVAAAAASTAVMGLATPAAAAAPLGCGSVVTHNVTLDKDITNCPGDGLVIGASGITIDLNGHRLDGLGNGAGISNPDGHDGVAVIDGRIENFLFGVKLTDTKASRVSKVTFYKVLYGVFLTRSHSNAVEYNAMIGLRDGDAGVGIKVDGTGNRVYRNTLRDFRWKGIYVGANAISTEVAENKVSVSGHGIYVEGAKTKVRYNSARYNVFYGIVMSGPNCNDDGSCSQGASGVLKGNTADHNAWDGITLSTSAVTVANNQANYNAYMGIEGEPGINDGGGNRAIGNGSTPPCTYVVCS